MPLLLIAAVVCSGALVAFPKDSSAAGGVVKYNVEILDKATAYDRTTPTVNNESPSVNISSVNNQAAGAPTVYANEGITFQMSVNTKKLMTEKLKTGPASYYPVTIIAKSFKAPIAHYQNIAGDTTYEIEISTIMAKDAIGKLYTSGGDVNVASVQAANKLTTKIGDGTADPAGSLVIPMLLTITHKLPAMHMTVFAEKKVPTTWTTGQSSILFKGTKSGLEGKAFPDLDSSGMLPKPLVGVPLDLDAGTGTLVTTYAAMKMGMALGSMDVVNGSIWVMKITPASK